MEFSKPLKMRLRYILISYPYNNPNSFCSNSLQSSLSLGSPLKTLVSPPKPSLTPILTSNQFHKKPSSRHYISSTVSSLFCSKAHPSGHSSQSLLSNTYNGYNSYSRLRWFSSSFDGSSSTMLTCVRNSHVGIRSDMFSQCATPKQLSEIIQLIKSGDIEMESKLDSMNVSLSIASVIEILWVLNCEKVHASRFFKWFRHIHPEFSYNSDICCLAIDNCGRLDDYETMRYLLGDFRMHGVCLTQKAFGFIPVMVSTKASTKKSLSRVVEVLIEVKGSCYVSGVRALIELFTALGSYKWAKYVMKKTEMKVSYFNIMVREMCRRCDLKGARGTLDEMWLVGCRPNTQTYNYILSSLCKNGKNGEACELFKDMQDKNCPPDAITYEIFICDSCRFDKFNVAVQFFDLMVDRGLEPRLSTHAAFIKGYFNLQRYEEAYEYVVGAADKFKMSSNMMYSLLANLHVKNRNTVIAQKILLEMINKGLRPQFLVYKRVLKLLQMSGREEMATYLISRFSSLSLQSSVEAG